MNKDAPYSAWSNKRKLTMQTIIQNAIIDELNVKPTIIASEEAERRIQFLMDYLVGSRQKAYVLGVSGGIDSTTAARLAQIAVERLRHTHPHAKFIAVRLPYGTQRDEDDARKALEFIQPDEVRVINIERASDAMLFETVYDNAITDPAHEDFVMGNIKARMRMVAQYAIAGAVGGLVIGTDHASEALMGFFTKHGDGAADIVPLAGLTKDQVREIATYLGVPEHLVNKPPTADLESLRPGLLDEEAFGFPYEHTNMYLKGQEIPQESEDKILAAYINTMHKRELPIAPPR